MLELCRRPLGSCFGVGSGSSTGSAGGGNGLEHSYVWQTILNNHAFGEYSMAVYQANCPLEDQGQVLASPSATFVGVFDGHGGPEASRFINNHLFSFIQQFATELGGISTEVLKKAFEATEKEFIQLVRKTWITNPRIALSGSCCLVGAIYKDHLYLANLGDSRAVLGRKVTEGGMFTAPTVVAERLTSDHNVANEEIRKEVRALHPDDSHIVVYTRGFWRIKGIIQVSRAIGDIYLKYPEFSNLYQQFGQSVPLKKAVITAEPSVSVRKLDSDDLFVIFASDGLWEHLSDQAAAEIVYRSPRVGIAKRLARAAVQESLRKRGLHYEDLSFIDRSARRQIHDDIMVAVVYLDYPHCPSNGGMDDDSGPLSHCVTPLDVASYYNTSEVDYLL